MVDGTELPTRRDARGNRLMRWVRVASPNDAELDNVVQSLCAGEIAIIPTDTVYGLAALAHKPQAVLKIFNAKGRHEGKPLIVGVANQKQLLTVVSSVPEDAEKLADKFWPGPISLILPKHESIPDLVTVGGKTVAVRIPNNPITLRLLENAGPLVMTSANLSGSELPLTAEVAVEQVGLHCFYVVDSGPALTNVASTIVDMTTEPPAVLREGAVPSAKVFDALKSQRQ